MGERENGSHLGLLSGKLDMWQGPPEPEESRLRRQEFDRELQKAAIKRIELSLLKSKSKIEHLSDDEFGNAFEKMLSRFGIGMQGNSLTRDLEIIAAMLPAMPEFKRKRQRPNLPRGSGGKKYDRYSAVVQYQRENAGSETLTTVEIVRRLLKANHKDFAGYPLESMVKDVSEGKRIWNEAARKFASMRAAESDKS